jgi:hypothetical protein
LTPGKSFQGIAAAKSFDVIPWLVRFGLEQRRRISFPGRNTYRPVSCGKSPKQHQENLIDAFRARFVEQPEDVADLETCDQNGEFKRRGQQAVLDISGSDKNSDEDERARRDKNQNLEESPEDRSEQDAPD